MALYAIGDFHLSIVSVQRVGLLRRRNHYQLYKPMDVFDPVWKDHADHLETAFRRTITQEDTIVITGDHSWGNTLEECRPDFDFIASLPGRKILTRGNHDLFWAVNKTARLNELFQGQFSFLQNNFYSYRDYALVGTKGICFESKMTPERFEHVREKEIQRLRLSFESAAKAGFQRFILFLHYPPTSPGEEESCFTRIAHEYGVQHVIYSHLHGQKRYGESLRGLFDGIDYSLVSSDYLRFQPKKILD